MESTCVCVCVRACVRECVCVVGGRQRGRERGKGAYQQHPTLQQRLHCLHSFYAPGLKRNLFIYIYRRIPVVSSALALPSVLTNRCDRTRTCSGEMNNNALLCTQPSTFPIFIVTTLSFTADNFAFVFWVQSPSKNSSLEKRLCWLNVAAF